MKKVSLFLILPLLITIVISCTILTDDGKNKFHNEDIWISVYFASWNHLAPPEGNWGNIPTDAIDWQAFTHIIYFTFIPQEDGSILSIQNSNNLNESRLTTIVEAAHSNDTPILFTLGGWNTRPAFLGAMSDDNRQAFIDNLIQILNRWNFDGIDINMEPIREEDKELYTKFITELHSALQQEKTPLLPTPLLTAAVRWEPKLFGELESKFNQINVMTYDMSSTWEGWVTWHNSPLYTGGRTFPNSSQTELPSVHRSVTNFLEAGVSREKLGLGIDFYGYIWRGVSEPLEDWEDNNPPNISPQGGVAYHRLHDMFNIENPEWDEKSKVPYISIEDPKTFVSFENPRSIQEKINYAKNNSLGGAIIWELGGGYRSKAPEGQKDVLLKTVKKELLK